MSFPQKFMNVNKNILYFKCQVLYLFRMSQEPGMLHLKTRYNYPPNLDENVCMASVLKKFNFSKVGTHGFYEKENHVIP